MSIKLKSFLLLFSFFALSPAFAQIIEDPTVWTITAKKKSGNQYDLVFHVDVKNNWHIYSLDPGGDGSFLPPDFRLDKSTRYKVNGKITEKGKKIDETIEDIGTVHYYKNVDYIVPITVDTNGKITGKYEYMTCNDQGCLPPKTKKFSVEVNDPELPNAATTTTEDTAVAAPADTQKKTEVTPIASSTDKKGDGGVASGGEKSLAWLFFACFVGGLLAVLTPCVFSMIPITVSFFTKRSKTKKEGLKNALYYAGSIIIIFTILGVLISIIFGPAALYKISTNWILNLVFFALFVVFGISFLGAFEITLPSSWTSKTDSKAGLGSFTGIFFMALTLVIVSFSCTGPILGALVVYSTEGGIVGPMVGMFAFSVGFALPFAFFAFFPEALNRLGSAGGWLNQVKVTLGFLELALALKFFSNADLVMGWRLLDREIFIALWIAIAILLSMYLLGKLKLSHDDATPKNIYGQEYISTFKVFLVIGLLSFALYLLPGMWGAPLKSLGTFIPPMGTQDYVVTNGGGNGAGKAHAEGEGPVKYVKEMEIYEPDVVKNYGLVTYLDYEEGLAAAKRLRKPVMLDFTGITCVNCRKMETQVWSSPEVLKRLKDDFVLISLFCDAKVPLVKGDEYVSKRSGEKIETLGDKCLDLQITNYKSNSQPFYIFVDENGNKLADEGYGYDPNVQKFINHLDKVKEKYNQTK